MNSVHRLLVLGCVVSLVPSAFGGSFTGTTDDPPNRVGWIVHPNGYSGSGGVVDVTVCIDPNSPFAQEMVAPLKRAIDRWNGLVPTNENLNPNTTVPVDQHDFESAVLHELGHCTGRGHINQPIAGIITSGYTEATFGPNGVQNFNNGPDGIQGSSDDDRGDDINVLWFRKADNDPFLIGATVDSTTYSRDIADLPAGDDQEFAQNANNSVGANIFGLPNAKSVMFTTLAPQEERRHLGTDDVATVRYGQSGLDEMQGTGDDYTVNLAFLGKVLPCQITVRFEDTVPAVLGRCGVSYVLIAGDHYQLSSKSVVQMDPDLVTWHFGDSPNLTISVTDGDVTAQPGDTVVYTVEVANIGQIDPTGTVEVVTTIPANTTFDAGMSAPEWDCMGSTMAGTPCLIQL